MVSEKIRTQFRISFILLALIIIASYWLILGEAPFFDVVQARIYFILMITSMIVFISLLENYVGWNKKSPEKLKERSKQITFMLAIPWIFLVLTGWGYTLFLIMVMGVPLGLSIVEEVPVFHYVKITRKKVLLTAVIFIVLYLITKRIYLFEFLEKETIYILLISHMISSIIANFAAGIKKIRKKFNNKKTY